VPNGNGASRKGCAERQRRIEERVCAERQWRLGERVCAERQRRIEEGVPNGNGASGKGVPPVAVTLGGASRNNVPLDR